MPTETETKFLLGEHDIPTHWVNLLPDLPGDPLPPLNPQTKEPAGPEDLTPIFPMSLIQQEVSTAPEVEIPDQVREVYKLWRPTPLYRAHRLEKALDTPAHIYYKYEGVSPAGSHKPNTAVAQAYYNKADGIRRLTTETEAGQRKVILFNLSGHGHFDMGAYDAYLAGALQDYAYPSEAIQQALGELPN